jgi:hypothetical protein
MQGEEEDEEGGYRPARGRTACGATGGGRVASGIYSRLTAPMHIYPASRS